MSDSLRPHGLYSLPGSSIHGIFQEYWSGLPCYQRPLKEIGHVIPFSSVQLLSRVQLFATPWTAAHLASLSIMNSQSLLKLISIESVMPCNYLTLCCPLLLLPSIFPSEGLLLNHEKTPGFLASEGEEFNPGPETRLDHSELLCNRVLLKCKRDRESF